MAYQTTDRLIRLPEVLQTTGLARSTIYRLIKQDEFPEFFKLSERVSAWSLSEIQEWISKKGEARKDQA
jgi:prophage regulatory protein